MNEEITQNMPDGRSFEERVFARFDALDTSIRDLDSRLQKLEARAYDTKPIWERALAELIELGKRMDNLDRRFSVLNDDVVQTRADYRKLEQRVINLEQPPHA